MQTDTLGVATAESTPCNTGLVTGVASDGTTNTTNVVSGANAGHTQQQPATSTTEPSECTSISMSTSVTNATTDATPTTSGGTRTASPRTASSEDANTLCGLANFSNMRVTVDNAESAREVNGADLRVAEDMRGVSDSKSMSSDGVAKPENTASAANVKFKAPVSGTAALGSEGECGECAHGADSTNGAQTEGTDDKGGGDSNDMKTEEGSDIKDSKEGKSNPFMHVEECRGLDSRGSALCV